MRMEEAIAIEVLSEQPEWGVDRAALPEVAVGQRTREPWRKDIFREEIEERKGE